MQKLFITGTDTGVGKTYVTAAIVRACREAGLRVGACKPVCSGVEFNEDGQPIWSDVEILSEALGGSVPVERICSQRFQAPLAPPAAAALEDREVDFDAALELIESWEPDADLLLVEGVGGLLCPFTASTTIADLIARSEMPLLIVAALRLGVINQTLLTIEAARSRQLAIAGVLFNQIGPADPAGASSIAEVSARGGVPVLGVCPSGKAIELRPPEVIHRIDWRALAATRPI